MKWRYIFLKSTYQKKAPNFNETSVKNSATFEAGPFFYFFVLQGERTIGKKRRNTPRNLSTPQIARKFGRKPDVFSNFRCLNLFCRDIGCAVSNQTASI